ncbi:MAG: phosphoribosyl-AMP cyclohydrolase [Fibrobacteria bacterium]|nr:phosphoribosyl-AMP cyclohydrolase [Fibrobacteria bacterium]
MSEFQDIIDSVKFDDKGLVSAIAIDESNGNVLMLAYMNKESLQITFESKVMTYWSRSRQKLWIKGETSGNIQEVKKVQIDCDGDALLFMVKPKGLGAACHTGHYSCFFRELKNNKWESQGTPLFDPNEVYKK